MRNVVIEEVKEVEDDGFYEATIGCHDHMGFMTIIGANLTECVRRAVFVINALEGSDVK